MVKAKGVAAKFTSYESTVPRFLKLIKFDEEIKKHNKIILKPSLNSTVKTPVAFMEQVLQFCMANKDPNTEIFIAEGADSGDTTELFESHGYKELAEHYGISLIDLNEAEVESIEGKPFMKFESIKYPKFLLDAYIISMPKLAEDAEFELSGSLPGMIGAFPASHYRGFFSSSKNKIRKWDVKYSLHDLLQCKMPNFALVDASDYGHIIAGQPLEVDKQSAKLAGKTSLSYISLVEDTLRPKMESEEDKILKEAIEKNPDLK
jgi:uncharacterized protein (DUF362 family)